MGTRADFYVKHGKTYLWRGSIAWDGYVDGIDHELFEATTVKQFSTTLDAFFKKRDDVTLPADGWPWPWTDSSTTDYAYIFDAKTKTVRISHNGGPLYDYKHHKLFKKLYARWNALPDQVKEIKTEPDFDKYLERKKLFDEPKFPDMSKRQNVQLFGTKSGLIVI